MYERAHKDATSLSLNKYILSGSQNPILHSSKSLTKPCDHFVVYLYQSLEKLNRIDTSYMLIPFRFWNSAQKTFFLYPPTLMLREYILLIFFFFFSCQAWITMVRSGGLVHNNAGGGKASRAQTDRHSTMCNTRGWNHTSSNQLKRRNIMQMWSLGLPSQTISSRVIDISVRFI